MMRLTSPLVLAFVLMVGALASQAAGADSQCVLHCHTFTALQKGPSQDRKSADLLVSAFSTRRKLAKSLVLLVQA